MSGGRHRSTGGPDPRRSQIAALVAELTERGFATPALDVEVPDPDTGIALAVAEAFWADGLQPGLGKPVVLELDPEEADLPRLAELGCDVFTSVDALRNFVERSRSSTPSPIPGRIPTRSSRRTPTRPMTSAPPC